MSDLHNWIFGIGGPQHADGVHFPFPRNLQSIGLTQDSYGRPDRLNWNVKRVDSPHWLPPSELITLLATAEWSLDFTYTAPDGFPTELDGTNSLTWTAGTSRYLSESVGTTIDEVSNTPGWTAFRDALARTRYHKPEPDEDEYADLFGLGSIEYKRYVLTDDGLYLLAISCFITEVRPAWYATVAPDSTSPDKWIDHDGLTPVWEFDIDFSGAAYYSGVDDPGGPAFAGVQTGLGTYDGDLIGRNNTSSPTDDDAFEIELTPSTLFTEF